MDLGLLQELKQKLMHDAALPPVSNFFSEHFGHDPEFVALGEVCRHAFVEQVVAQVAQQMFPGDGQVQDLLLARLETHQFIHGGFFVNGRPGQVIYFDDARIGLVTICDRRPSIEVKYARFSGVPLQPQPRPQGGPSLN
jgi:hypothetical protein